MFEALELELTDNVRVAPSALAGAQQVSVWSSRRTTFEHTVWSLKTTDKLLHLLTKSFPKIVIVPPALEKKYGTTLTIEGVDKPDYVKS